MMAHCHPEGLSTFRLTLSDAVIVSCLCWWASDTWHPMLHLAPGKGEHCFLG